MSFVMMNAMARGWVLCWMGGVLLAGALCEAAPGAREALPLAPGENYITAMVVDPAHDFVYAVAAADNFPFALETASSTLLSIQLPDFSRGKTLTLAPGESPVSTALIDASRRMLYLGTYGDPHRRIPARVVKIDLKKFRSEASLPLAEGQWGIRSGVIDPAGQTGYFGTLFGNVVGVRLADLSLLGSVGLGREENDLQVAGIDPPGTTAVFATGSGNLLKVRLSDFTPVASLAARRESGGFVGGFMDRDGRTLVLGSASKPPKIFWVDAQELRIIQTVSLDQEDGALVTGLLNSKTGDSLWVTHAVPPKIIRFSGDRRRQETLTLAGPLARATAAALHPGRGVLLIALAGSPAVILKMPCP